jgi:hypothetical protein
MDAEGKPKTKAVQVRLTEEEWRFLRRLALDLDATVSDVFRRYVAWLRRGGQPIGFERKAREE